MSECAAPGTTFTARTQGWPTGYGSGIIGVAILRESDEAVITARTTTGITEPETGVYAVTLTAPATTGDYLIVWTTVTPAYRAEESLRVAGAAAIASATDLCTLADVRLQLQKPVGDTDQDALITNLITAASRAIHQWTGRQFIADTVPSTRTVPIGGYFRARLVPTGDLTTTPTSVLVIAEDGTTTATLTVATDTQPLYADSPFTITPMFGWQPVTGLRLRDSAGTIRATDQLQVTGTYGFPAVPEDVQRACITTVALWMRRDVQAFSTTYSVDEGRLERPEALPSQVMRMLGPYRLRPGMA